jgi:muramoyltetrapeptide carboxypeptidase
MPPITPIKPQRLEPGQTISLVAPAGCTDEDEEIVAAIETVASLGFRVKTGAHLQCRHGYFAGADAERAADLNAAFADPEVHGIIAMRGDYGASRLLPHLDFAMIRRHPKVLLGYSDITALLNPIYGRTGLVTFHGPIGDQTFTPYTLAEFRKVVMQGAAPVLLAAPPPCDLAPGRVERRNRLTTLAPGKARGPLIGGNLTLLTHLVGTPYLPDFRGAILFLEDVDELVYRVDRMLTQLLLAGHLQQVAGLVFGKFTNCPPASGPRQFTLEEVLADRCRGLGIPVVRGLMIGHVEDQATLPIGCQVELDADACTLRLLEPAVC